jgi:hypothetical protein
MITWNFSLFSAPFLSVSYRPSERWVQIREGESFNRKIEIWQMLHETRQGGCGWKVSFTLLLPTHARLVVCRAPSRGKYLSACLPQIYLFLVSHICFVGASRNLSHSINIPFSYVNHSITRFAHPCTDSAPCRALLNRWFVLMLMMKAIWMPRQIHHSALSK